jgi:hypothetical protein
MSSLRRMFVNVESNSENDDMCKRCQSSNLNKLSGKISCNDCGAFIGYLFEAKTEEYHPPTIEQELGVHSQKMTLSSSDAGQQMLHKWSQSSGREHLDMTHLHKIDEYVNMIFDKIRLPFEVRKTSISNNAKKIFTAVRNTKKIYRSQNLVNIFFACIYAAFRCQKIYSVDQDIIADIFSVNSSDINKQITAILKVPNLDACAPNISELRRSPSLQEYIEYYDNYFKVLKYNSGYHLDILAIERSPKYIRHSISTVIAIFFIEQIKKIPEGEKLPGISDIVSVLRIDMATIRNIC